MENGSALKIILSNLKSSIPIIFLLIAQNSLASTTENTLENERAFKNEITSRLNSVENTLEIQKHIVTNSIENSDKRLADFSALATMQGSHTAWVGNLVALVSIGITILVFAAGFLTYTSSKNRAIKEARQTIDDWIEKNTANLQTQLEVLRNEIHVARLQIAELIENVKKGASEANKYFDEHKKKIDEAYQAFGRRKAPESNENDNYFALTEDIDKSHESFDILLKKGADEYRNGNLSESLTSFDAAFRVSDNVPLVKFVRLLLAKQFAYRGLNRHSEALSMHEEILSRTALTDDPEIRYMLAESFLNKAAILSEQERSNEELEVYDEIIQRFNIDSSIDTQTVVARAMVNKGVTLSSLGRSRDEIKAYDTLLEKFNTVQDPKMRERLSHALLYKAITLGQLGDFEAELDCYSKVIDTYQSDKLPDTRENVARAFIQKALRLSMLGKNIEALKIYEIIERRYKSDPSPIFHEITAKSFLGRGIVLAKLDRQQEEIEQYQKVEGLFLDNPLPEYIRKITSNSMLLKALALISLQRKDEAKQVLHQLLSRFGGDDNGSVQQNVISARNILETINNQGGL